MQKQDKALIVLRLDNSKYRKAKDLEARQVQDTQQGQMFSTVSLLDLGQF